MTSILPNDSFLQLPSLKRSPRTRTSRTRINPVASSSPPSRSTAMGCIARCPPPPCTSLEGRSLCIIPELSEREDEVDEVVIMPAMSEDEEEEEQTPDSPSIYSPSPMPSPSDLIPLSSSSPHYPSPSLSRSSSIKSIPDSDSALEARLSAYEFSIDDSFIHSFPTALSVPRIFAPSQLPASSSSSPPSFLWSAPTGEVGGYYDPPEEVDDDDDDFFCSTSPVNTTTSITCTTSTTTANSNSNSNPNSICECDANAHPDSFRLTFSDVSLKFPHPPSDAYTRSFSLSHSHPQSQSQSQSQAYPHPYSFSHPDPRTPPPTHTQTKTMSPTPSISSSTSASTCLSTKSTKSTSTISCGASTHSSPSSHSSDLPSTPTSSDDGILLLSQKGSGLRPKRASMRPLVIVKPVVRVVCDDDEQDGEGVVAREAYAGLRYKLPSEVVVVSSTPHSYAHPEENEDEEGEDYESLNEWYTEQLSSIVTLQSASSPHPSQHPSGYSSQSQLPAPQVPSLPTDYAPARPDSIFMLAPLALPRFSFAPAPAPAPAHPSEGECNEASTRPGEPAQELDLESTQDAQLNEKRNTKPLPEIPAVLMPSDPTLPRRKRTVVSGTGSVLGLLESAGLAPYVLEREGRKAEHRPPPRSSVPVDMGMDEWVDHHHHHHHHGRRSNGEGVDIVSRAVISRPAHTATPVDLDEFTMEDDMPLKFPVSLPTSPVDPIELEAEFGMGYGGRSHHHQQQQSLVARSSSSASATAAVRAGVPSTLLIPRSEVSTVMMEPALPETPTWDMYSPIATSTSSNARTLGPSGSNTRTLTLINTANKTSTQTPTDQEIERALYSRWSASTLSSQLERERVMAVQQESEKVKASTRSSSMFKSYFDFGSKSKKGRRSLRFSSLSSSSPSSSSTAPAVSIRKNRNSTSTGNSGKHGNSSGTSPVLSFFTFPSSPRSPTSYFLPPTPPPSKKEFSVRLRAGRSSNESEKMSSGAGGGVRRSASRGSINTNASGSMHSECGSHDGPLRQTRKQIPVEMFIKC